MNDFNNLDGAEQRLIFMDALIQYQGVKIHVLEVALAGLMQRMGVTISGDKSLAEHCLAESDRLMREKIRVLADHDPNGAARLSSIFELMKASNKNAGQ